MPTIVGPIKWSTIGQPNPAGGICENYTYKPAAQVDTIDDENGDPAAKVLHSIKGDITWEVTRAGTVTGVKAGQIVTVTGVTGGVVVIRSVVEKFTDNGKSTLSISATHYPDVGTSTANGTGDLSAPTQTAPTIVPDAAVLWGTSGITHGTGVVKSASRTMEVQIAEYSDGAGKIVAIAIHGYSEKIDLEVLTTLAATLPAIGAALALTGIKNADTAIITSAEQRFARAEARLFSISAEWFAAMAA